MNKSDIESTPGTPVDIRAMLEMSNDRIRTPAEQQDRIARWLLPRVDLNFERPGYIDITAAGKEMSINLEEMVNKLEFGPDEALEWERIFARLAHLCRRKLPLASYPSVHPASGHAPNCGLWEGLACSCGGRCTELGEQR